ncbi:MAG: insulinase family protein [Elusimicrobia bacterium]|nr:insulinase family protein [Elusimicrobiota bacterium]
MLRYPLLLALLLASAPSWAAEGKIAFQSTTLSNGLTVVTHEDRSMPVVAVNIWYKVGSKNEQIGRTGFAHLFEHYMFEGSAHSPSGEYFQKIFGMGGVTNANTTLDRTDYFAIVPSENLEEVLRLESDRMGFLRSSINAKSLDKQRAIVKNEKRLGENKAYGGLFEDLSDTAWPQGHPYKSAVIGSMQDLDAAAVADVKAFHETWYNPNNAVLVISGDFDTPDALAKVRKWFGGLPAGATPPALNVPSVANVGRTTKVVEDEKAQVPLVILAYRIPGKGKPGWNEMSVVSQVLGGGRTSRLVRTLQYERQMAVEVSAQVFGFLENDLFFVEAVPAPGVTVAALTSAVEAEIAKVGQNGIQRKELNRVKAGIRTARLDALQTAGNVAEALAEGQGAFGSPSALEDQADQVLKMRTKDATAAAGRYLKPDNAAVLTINPKTGAPQ